MSRKYHVMTKEQIKEDLERSVLFIDEVDIEEHELEDLITIHVSKIKGPGDKPIRYMLNLRMKTPSGVYKETP